MSLENRDFGEIWMDGKYVPWQEAKVHALTNTLHYGAGVFEGVRAYESDKDSSIFRMHDHTNRLFQSAHIIGMKIPYTKKEINDAQIEILKRNKLKSAYIRPMAYYGGEALGLLMNKLSVRVMIAAWDWGSYLGEENLIHGIKVGTSSYTRNHVNSVLSKAKANGNYLNSIMARQEAVHNGHQEALLLEHQGYVAEGSGENIFVVKDGKIYTPTLTSALAGITRDTIIHIAQNQGMEVKEIQITRDMIYIADEAFFTGTAAEVTPIRELDGRTIGSGKRGEITEHLQKSYFSIVKGKMPDYEKYLTRYSI